MTLIPARGKPIDLWQGRTLIVSWTLREPKVAPATVGVPTDMTNWKAWLLLWGSDIDAPVKELSWEDGVAPVEGVSQGTSGIVLYGAVEPNIMAILTDEDALTILPGSFTEAFDDNGRPLYTGGYELVLEDPAGERFPYTVGTLNYHRTAPIS